MSSTAAFSVPDQAVTFSARRSELRLVKTPKHPIYGPNGQRQGETVGETIAFRDGVLRVPASGKVTLEDGRQASAEEILEWMRGHRLFGNADGGFVEIGQVAPPVSQEEMQVITDAAIALDIETLEAIKREESAGWARETVLTTVEKALTGVAEAKEAVAKEIAEREKNAAVAAKAQATREANAEKAKAEAAKNAEQK